MYRVTVEARFAAVHNLRLHDGRTEPPHRHDWLVRASFTRNELDEAGMVIDFDRAREWLRSITSELHGTDLNHQKGLNGRNPSAEAIARYVFDRLVALGLTAVSAVEVTEAPGCVASYEPCRTTAQQDRPPFDDG